MSFMASLNSWLGSGLRELGQGFRRKVRRAASRTTLPRLLASSAGALGCVALVIVALVVASSMLGCESSKPTTRPLSFRERQDQALRDPMNYKPDFSEDRISSGGITDFDDKGFKRDLGRVLNP